MTRGPAVSGPSSTLGIMRFFDADTSGPKLSPEFVVGIAIVLIVSLVALKVFLGI
ncbi:MAG: preprotein translocase subunit Sec61beta [Candidatus Diapherotrites archaeon]|uniref:Preprotein translocase subunit Sec61beta n=1 Tax=Candidatus Iainarchaeum sp. TaxID=3101447 RepID=A0A938YX15_9ARCH|nr:preprotein translocase subunit Sec61beta [Candidatus Diapherotrites archaeon]